MPTISQLPVASQATATDQLPISQGGVACSVSIGTLLAGTQPAILAATGTLLGRTSLGPGGPDSVEVGIGLLLNTDSLVATGADHAGFPMQDSLTLSDEVVLSSGGNPKLLQMSLLRGLFSPGSNISIDQYGTISATPAGGVSTETSEYSITDLPTVTAIASSDLVAISQSGLDHTITYANLIDGQTIDQAQTAAAAADTDTFLVAQNGNTMLRQTLEAVWIWLNSKIPGYLLPTLELTTNTILNTTIHNGRVLICSQPITITTALTNMGNGFACDLINVSTGNVTLGSGITTSSGTSSLPLGQAAALTCVTYSGGTLVYAWTTAAASSPNAAGSGLASGVANASTVAGNSVISITWNATPSGSYTHGISSIGINAQVSPSSAPVQFGFSTSPTAPPTSWTAGSYVNSSLWGAYVSTPSVPGTWYAWAEGVDGSMPTVYPTGFLVI